MSAPRWSSGYVWVATVKLHLIGKYSSSRDISGTIANKINGTCKGAYLPFLKLHLILAVANSLSHNNISHICFWCQISLQSVAVNCCFSGNLTPLEIPFILMVIVPASPTPARPFSANNSLYLLFIKFKCYVFGHDSF